MEETRSYALFSGVFCEARGDLSAVLRRAKALVDRGEGDGLLIFDDATGAQVEFDLRGSVEEVLARAAPVGPRAGPGRPKLGVVSREVSLLPRHWAWLEAQPQGISAAIRRLVDEARRRDPEGDRARQARFAAGRFMTSMAGDLPDYEEATRALYAGDAARFEALVTDWPGDVRDHALRLARPSFRGDGAAGDGVTE